MNRDDFSKYLTKLGLACAVLILVFVPFHAFLTVWLASGVGHYTALRLWSLLLLMLALGCVKVLAWRHKALRGTVTGEPLTWVIVGYIAVQVIWGVGALMSHHVTAKALAYGLIVNVRFLIFFFVTWVLCHRTNWLHRHWTKLVFWPAGVVIMFALLQYFVLPYDVMKHFGYGASTIYPYETINHNVHHLRVMSTLRGANPLGAYLVVVLSLALARFVCGVKKRWQYAVFILAGAVVLVLTFSRSAWIGFVLATSVILVHRYYKHAHIQRWLMTGCAILLMLGAGIVAIRHSTSLQDAFLHTDNSSTIAQSSNQGHVSALKNGLHDIVHEPLGRGPGSAGPASVYNDHKVRIAENYFVQIGQETGWLGLLTFVVVNVLLGLQLWKRRDNELALGLLAALIGVSFVNLLSHAWTDDTLAFLWWGLAGMALVVRPKHDKHAI